MTHQRCRNVGCATRWPTLPRTGRLCWLQGRRVRPMATRRHGLAQRRKAVGYSQEQLAEQLGVDRTTVIRWETGETEPQPWQWPNLADALKITADQLTDLLDGASPVGTTTLKTPTTNTGDAALS